VIALALGVALACSVCASAQMIDNPVFGDFEINTAGSLEQDLLDQIRITDRVTAEQFPRLTRLIMLEAYAMHQNVRADLRTSQMGFNLEYQTLALFNSAQDLDAYVRTTAQHEPAGTIELRERFSDILRIYQTIDNSLGQLPGFSPSASRHFSELTQLLSIVNAVIAPSANSGTSTSARDARTDANRLNELAGFLVTELERMDLSGETRSAPGSVEPTFRDDQKTLVRMVQGFQRLLAAGPTMPEVVETWRVIRARTWEFERRIQQQSDHLDWRRDWQTARRRFDVISGQLQLPRVIIGSGGSSPVTRIDAAALARADHALEAVAKVSKVSSPTSGGVRIDPRTVEEVRQLDLELWQLRISLLAGLNITRHSRIVREIDTVDRAMTRRSQTTSRSGRIEHAAGEEELRGLHRAVVSLRDQFSR
jgi:hypothetical protein